MSEVIDALSGEARAFLSRVAPFATLDESELDRIASLVGERRAAPGEMIVREGERGDVMYLIVEGSVQVLGRAFDASDVVLARLDAGRFFGEQALLASGNSRRNASVRALTPCRLLVATREALEESLEEDGALATAFREAGERQRALRTSRLREEVLRNLGVAKTYRIERFAAGEWIFHQGEIGERLYLILAGSARAVRESGDAPGDLSLMLPGQFFGEVAVIEDTPRTASIQAVTDLEVASLEGSWFRGAITDHPELRAIMQSLKAMYMMPARGMMTLQAGKLGSQPTLTAVYHLPDRRQVITTRRVTVPAFSARLIGGAEADARARFRSGNDGSTRELHLSQGRIVGIETEGAWGELADVLALMLDGLAVAPDQLDRFRATGNLAARAKQQAEPVICRCANVGPSGISNAIGAGADDIDTLCDRTSAGLICGGCVPRLCELLGHSNVPPARGEHAVPLAGQIREFRIRPSDGGYTPNRPGQHLIVQARIEDNLVERAYTVAASPADDSHDIIVKRQAEGLFSRWLFDNLSPDTLLRLSQPTERYQLADEFDSDVVCLAGGIGSTRALAMARLLAARSAPTRLHIDCSVSRAEDAVRLDALEELARTDSRITLNVRVTRRDGRIDAKELGSLTERFPGALFYLCAGPAYVDTVEASLLSLGVARDKVRVEPFAVADTDSGSQL